MENNFLRLLSPEFQKAIKEGYVHAFEFIDGYLFCGINPGNKYSIPTCHIYPRPCLDTWIIIYRIWTPDDIKGTAIITMNQDDELLR